MPTSLELYAENENEIESKACVFETEYNVRNQKMLRIHFYGNEKINCPGFKKISVKDMMENRQKVFIILNDSTLKEFELRIFDWTTVGSLINVQSVINVKGDKFSKKNKLTGSSLYFGPAFNGNFLNMYRQFSKYFFHKRRF